MSAAEVVLAGRAEAEALMLTGVVVSRPGAPVTDADGAVVTPLAEVFTGFCKVQTTVAQATSPVAGGHSFMVENLQLHFPVLSSLRVDDVAIVVSSAMDPDLVGLSFRIIEAARGTYRTADRWNVELVTG